MMRAYAKVALKGKESHSKTLFIAKEKFVIDLLRLYGCGIDEPGREGGGREAGWDSNVSPLT
jgi:hypothetical protein